jgi:hypothetical protein
MIDDHMRFRVYTKAQHPYNHSLAEMTYSNPAMPGVNNGNTALDWIFAVLYPQTKPSVATVAALPAGGNTLNDYRVVQDDGDGKAASYRWEQREGEASASWHKVYDMDWGSDSILEAFYNKTQDTYVGKFGYDDVDGTGTAKTGDAAGQSIFGGRTAGGNLSLYPNSGDGSSSPSGFVQVAATVRPLTGVTADLGQTARRFGAAFFTGAVTAGTAALSGGQLADSSGAFSFNALNLTTTGWSKAAQFLGAAGNAGAPGLGFQSEASGWFLQAAGKVSLAVAGAEAFRFAAGAVLAPQGAVGAPAWSFLADSQTGVWCPSIGQWAVSTAGTARLLIDSSGNMTLKGGKWTWDATNERVGIGGAPSVDLHLQKASSPTMRLDSQNSAGTTPGEIQFFAARAANANLAALDDMGYLDWYGRVSGASTWLAGIQGRYRGNGATSFADIIFVTSNGGAPAERVRIRYDGNVGFGVVDPLYPVHVSGALAAANFLVSGNTLSATNAGGGIAIVPNGTGRVTVGVGLDPAADGSASLGQVGARWDSLYLKSNLGDGTNVVASSVLTSLRNVNVGVSAGYGIFWDGAKWIAADPDTEVFHDAVSHLTGVGTDGDAGHTQFAVLAGRSSGQVLRGGTGASQNLTLESTSHATKGSVLFGSKAAPFADAVTDVGSSGNRWANLYMVGQAFGLRVENYATAGRPSATAGTAGRLYWDTTTLQLMVDQGGAWARAGSQNYRISDASGWTGSSTSVTYTVPAASFSDVRTGIWALQDNANNYKQILADIDFPAVNQVRVSVDLALAASTYTLVGVG